MAEDCADRWPVVVIGAGAAGLLAAARAAELGHRVLLLEKNRQPGVKILMSGGTRCNITHDTDERGIVEAYGVQGRFLHSALAALGPQELLEIFHAEGVATKVEPGGKVFPVSNRATDVLAALMARLARSGAELATEEPVLDLVRGDAGFTITTNRRTLSADTVIVTTGGQSYPGSGTCGDGYAWLERLGHTIITPRPGLTPLLANPTWLKAVQGITLPDVAVCIRDTTVTDTRSAILAQRRGSLLFAHFGFSGPVALDVSRVVSGHATPAKLELVCDFLPDLKLEALDELLRAQCAADGKKQLQSVLDQLLPEIPRRLMEVICNLCEVPTTIRAAELSKTTRRTLVHSLKQFAVRINGTLGFKKAEVTAGGVSLAEVDSRTMQSKLVPGLYLAGEILDLDGPIGGYNFQAAFSTGWLAAEKIRVECGEGI